MNIDQFSESRYLTKQDCGRGILVTITKIEVQNVARQDDSPENKPVIFFAEVDKGLACNKVNREMIANIVGSRETEHWPGRKIVLYEDPNIVYGGRITGGIRVRAPRPQAAAAPAPAPAPASAAAPPRPGGKPAPPPVEEDDSIPY